MDSRFTKWCKKKLGVEKLQAQLYELDEGGAEARREIRANHQNLVQEVNRHEEAIVYLNDNRLPNIEETLDKRKSAHYDLHTDIENLRRSMDKVLSEYGKTIEDIKESSAKILKDLKIEREISSKSLKRDKPDTKKYTGKLTDLGDGWLEGTFYKWTAEAGDGRLAVVGRYTGDNNTVKYFYAPEANSLAIQDYNVNWGKDEMRFRVNDALAAERLITAHTVENEIEIFDEYTI